LRLVLLIRCFRARAVNIAQGQSSTILDLRDYS
jgi:hypothetical protein